MNQPTVYLAGPIMGQTETEAKEWRMDMEEFLGYHRVRAVSPLRCEPDVAAGATYQAQYDCNKWGTPRSIGSKNLFDVRNCDLTFAYFPKGHPPSVGTLIEIGWARALDKPVVVVAEDPVLFNHPVIIFCAGWMLGNLSEAVEVIGGLLGDYL